MSAFIVSTETMNRVVSFILKNTETFCGVSTDAINAGPRIGAMLYKLNTDSVNYRYRDGEVAPEFIYKHLPTSNVQAYKAIRCFLYQCSEGEQFENSAAYQELAAARDSLAYRIISNLPEYSAAEWD